MSLPFPHVEDEGLDGIWSPFSHLRVNEMSLISPNPSLKKNVPTASCY